jgi:hypothetical protein
MTPVPLNSLKFSLCYRCLSDVLRRLPTTPPDRLAELLPDVWFQAHPNAARKRAA